MIFHELRRYFYAARIFRFFRSHPFIYIPVVRDLIEKRLRQNSFVKPRNIVIKLSSQCNARCHFCYANREVSTSRKELSFEELKDVILQAKNLGCYTVTLTGGEPLIYSRIFDLIRFVRSQHMLPFTTTNGLAANPAKIKKLERAGLCALNFSVHGIDNDHDEIVGVPGAFKKLFENARYAATQTSLVCIVNHVLTKDSCSKQTYAKIWSLFQSLGFRALNLLPICMSSGQQDTLLNHDELMILDDLAKNSFVLMDTKNYAKPKCPAAREDLLVNNYGEIQPCPFIPISFGNIREDNLARVFLKMQKHPMFHPQNSVCMPARDRKFIKTYLVPIPLEANLPVRIEEVMNFL